MIEQNHLWDIPEDETDVIVKKAIWVEQNIILTHLVYTLSLTYEDMFSIVKLYIDGIFPVSRSITKKQLDVALKKHPIETIDLPIYTLFTQRTFLSVTWCQH